LRNKEEMMIEKGNKAQMKNKFLYDKLFAKSGLKYENNIPEIRANVQKKAKIWVM